MFSQNDEEKVILDFFKGRTESFLDVGAYYGTDLSNTRQLALNGWSGILVEPAPEPFIKLVQNYKNLPKCICVNAAVDSDHFWKTFYYEKRREWAGTLNEQCLKQHEIQVEYTFMVRTVTMVDLFQLSKQNGMTFKFVSVDAEWSDYSIMENSWLALRDCELICVEKGPAQWEEFFHKIGFKTKIHETPENLLFAR